MAGAAATTFNKAMSRAPVSLFQWATVIICMFVLICDGIDLQLLGIVAPLVIHDFAVDRGTFGIAMSAALVGFGMGAWGGGWLGDRVGRRYALAAAALIFALATVAASRADGVWAMAMWRILGGLGFGAAYANTLAMAGEWMPERLRPVTVSTLSVGTPIGGAIVGWLGPTLAADHGWRGTFVIFGIATLLLVVIILALLRDSPSFLMARGKTDEATRTARRVLGQDVALVADHHDAQDGVAAIGVLHASNTRFNFGIGIAFTAFALVAYGILNWSTTFLTSAGFALDQAGFAVTVAGITSMVGSVMSGILTRRFGSRRVMAVMSLALLVFLPSLGFLVQTLPAVPTAQERLLVFVLIGCSGAVFSGGIAVMYVIMTFGYPQSCRSAGLGFGIFMSRVGAVGASGFGGALLELGHGSVVPFFSVLSFGAVLVAIAVVVIDRHVPPMKAG